MMIMMMEMGVLKSSVVMSLSATRHGIRAGHVGPLLGL